MKVKPWEGVAVDLVFKDKDPVTIAVLPRTVNLEQWVSQHINRATLTEPCFVYSYNVTIH